MNSLLRLNEREGAHRVPSSFAKKAAAFSRSHFAEDFVLLAQPTKLLTLFGSKALSLTAIDLCLA
jgi:hypothetical protein